MTVFFHELRRGRLSLLIWSAAISFMLGVCVLIYPEMSKQMGQISEMFADMGSFSAAFGMDELNFGEFSGYFGVECGNVLGLGGAFFSAMLGISVLSKEEKEHIAEFLLTHPISRTRVLTEKLCAVLAQILLLNGTVAVVTGACILIIGETVDAGPLALLLLAHLLLQIELAAITFGISALIRHSGIGIGLGLAIAFYFLNILANLTEALEFLKALTPFGYTDGATVIKEGRIDGAGLVIGMTLACLGVISAFLHYRKKDII